MFEKGRAGKAFDNCPNKTVKIGPVDSIFSCAKVPEGMEVYNARLNSGRKDTAIMLGCLACPFKDTPHRRLETTAVRPDGAIETSYEYVPMQADPSGQAADRPVIPE